MIPMHSGSTSDPGYCKLKYIIHQYKYYLACELKGESDKKKIFFMNEYMEILAMSWEFLKYILLLKK